MISDEILEEFKSRLHISHSSEDKNLTRMLSSSLAYVEDKCGAFKMDGSANVDKRARELVLERTRYAYNEALEYFEDNYLSEITSLGIDLLDGDNDEGK